MSKEKYKLKFMSQIWGAWRHKLNNNLGLIKIEINELLEDNSKFDEDTVNVLKGIKNKIESTLSIPRTFDKFLTTFEYEEQPVNLYNVLNNILTKNDFPNINFLFDDLKYLPQIKAHEIIIKEIFEELITNSSRAMPGGGKIFISGKVLHNKFVEISVKDTGCGIQKNHSEKIFELGFSNWNNQESVGSGYGLTWISTIIKTKLKGNIFINHNYKDGAEIILKLPFEVNTNEKKILVIEDDKQWSSIIKNILQQLGYTVYVAESYETAKKLLNTELFHFATIDMQLEPKTTQANKFQGYKLLKEIKDYPFPVMVITGFSESLKDIDTINTMDSGNIYLMSKSKFDKNELKQIVTENIREINKEILNGQTHDKQINDDKNDYSKLRKEFISASMLLSLILITSFLYFLLSNTFHTYQIQLSIIFSIIMITLISLLLSVFNPKVVFSALKILKKIRG